MRLLLLLAVLGQGDWVGQRVITKFGTVLKVGKAVVDDEDRGRELAVSGHDRIIQRTYRVQKVNSPWLWLVAEDESVSGWVKAEQVLSFEQAIDYYTSEIRARPTSAAYLNRGSVWNKKHEYDIAISDLNEAIRLDPKSEVAFVDRGLSWLNKKEYGKALADYNEAIRLDQKFAMAYNNRAWIWASCPDAKYRDGKRAVESATRACELA